MLGKLFAQEMRALWKPAAIMLAVMVVAGVVGIGCIEATDAVSRAAGFASRYVNEASAASNLTVVFVMAALFCGFLVWASLVAVYVFIAMRFYRTMFTDEGYLTLTLPVRAGTLVAAKFWAAFCWQRRSRLWPARSPRWPCSRSPTAMGTWCRWCCRFWAAGRR